MATMKASLLGRGWVTPMGTDIDEVCRQLLQGECAVKSPLLHAETGQNYQVCRVPREATAPTARLPRLRRSSDISHFAVNAALAAVENSGIPTDELISSGTVLLFASSDGCVLYTRKFYDGLQDQGPGHGSPLLFPETVYNAPTSHVAATLGLTAEALTFVGDATASISALRAALELLAIGAARYCLVVAAGELDGILCQAYSAWGKDDQNGFHFAEGSGALLLGSGPGPALSVPLCTANKNLLAVEEQTSQALKSIHASTTFWVGSESGNRDREFFQNGNPLPAAGCFNPRTQLGEGLAAASLWQVIFASHLVASHPGSSALCPVTGLNRQFGLVRLDP